MCAQSQEALLVRESGWHWLGACTKPAISHKLVPGMASPSILLFSYGTLQNKDIQIANFGRVLSGRQDALIGYVLRTVNIVDPAVAALIGESNCANAEPTSNLEDAIPGTVFEITENELAAADRYEEAANYRRTFVGLKSGNWAWVYTQP